jgi:hypothetical protein
MFGEWMQDLESLEAISQDDEARKIFLRMAAMSQEGAAGIVPRRARRHVRAGRVHEGHPE